MSESDKTRQKLLDSMRKTKAGVTGKSQSTEKKNTETSTKTKSKSRSTASKAAENTSSPETVSTDNSAYQSRPRVWPD